MFYARPTLQVAEGLLGKVLVHNTPAGLASGRIVEVEAYVGEADPACHAAPGPTRRNAPLYGPPGHAYVYLNYGVHYLVNVVTEPEGSPAAVLIRALEPLDGLALMRRRRVRPRTGRHSAAPRPHPSRPLASRRISDNDLCKGPGNVTHALGISLHQNRLDLLGAELYIEDRSFDVDQISWSPRIGITKGTESHWRCFAAGNLSVSGSHP
jgi:DNA-3-methyladenine glycosylase